MKTSSYIPLYILPAVNQSIYFFEEYGIYTFSEHKDSNFKELEYSQAKYVGIGRDFRLEETEKKYVQVQKIAKIVEIGKFEIDFNERELTHFAITKGNQVEEKHLKHIAQQHIDAYHKYTDGYISSETKKKRVYIFVKPESIIEVEENILYPTKSLVSFPLNIDEKGAYIPAKKFLKTIKVSENVFLNTEKHVLLVDGGEVVIGASNGAIYSKIIELFALGEEEYITTEELKKHIKKLNTDYDSIKDKIGLFNKGGFTKFLDFSLKFKKRGNTQKIIKVKKG